MNASLIRSTHEGPKDVITPFSFVAKILKIPVFRLSLDDPFSKLIISVHNFFSRLFGGGKSRPFQNFDPSRAESSFRRFVALGANAEVGGKEQFVTPRDGVGRVQMMTFRARDLEQRIRAFGGSWERRVVGGRKVFAIVPPEQTTEGWNRFKEKLDHFHWEEKEGMLITCDAADLVSEEGPPKCFLFAHSTSSAFTSDWRRAGFYIGAKQDFCFFDNGNTWKNRGRPPSEESFYLEIEAVYTALAARYSLQDLWIGGSCGGAPVAAYLKQVLHDQGVNFFVEQSFSDLNDFVQPISPFFAPRVKGSISHGPFSPQIENQPPSCHFDVQRLWEPLHGRKGRMVLVQVEKDEHLSEKAYEQYLQLARRVNAQTERILYASAAPYRHGDDFFRYEEPRRRFLQFIFSH